ncbi:MAG: transglutaminase-like domain-containing protein, partial [Fibrobacteria bacterium]
MIRYHVGPFQAKKRLRGTPLSRPLSGLAALALLYATLVPASPAPSPASPSSPSSRPTPPWAGGPRSAVALKAAAPQANSSKSADTTASVPGPSATLKAFDSLLESGSIPAARRLCAGQMLRMFDFIVLTQSKLAGLVDTARSSDTVLAEKIGVGVEVRVGESRTDSLPDSAAKSDDKIWAWVKVESRMFFKRPFLGQDSIRSLQAVHLYWSGVPPRGRGWLIAEMEELENASALVRLRSGIPEGVDTGSALAAADRLGSTRASPGDATVRPGLFPVSSRAPAKAGIADRLRYRIRLRSGASLSDACLLGPGQSLIRAVSNSEWILENSRAPSYGKDGRDARSHGKPIGADGKLASAAVLPPDSLRVYLASNPFLILEDTLLAATAKRLAGGETDPPRITRAIYRWVTESFHFELGAVLFGTSATILRDLTGDCSEAAVLTAALLRSRGVPARIALGFASLGRGVFIGHAWCEAWIDGRWTGVDAALREFPAGVERIKLANLDGRSDMRIAATNLMIRVLSNLDIEILGAWKEGKA